MVSTQALLKPPDDAPCLCGSGRAFIRCCGDPSSDRAPPAEVVVAGDFLTAEVCRSIVEYADRTAAQPMRQDTTKPGGGDEVKKVRSAQRVGELVPIDGMADEIVNLVGRAWRYEVEPRFHMELEWFECPQLLRYGPGGRYVPHADSDVWNPEQSAWQRAVDRDFSLLIYLDQSFTGGSLSFLNFNYVLHPKPGMLVYFPSDARYLHEATPVQSGRRHVLVSWAASFGTPRVRPRPPQSAFFMPKRKD